jgi:hypothetical protein
MLMIEPGTKNGETLRIPPAIDILPWFPQSAANHQCRNQSPPLPARVGSIFLIQAGITHRLNASSHTEMDESIHAARILGRNIVRDVKVLDLAGNLGRKGGGVELGDMGDTGAAGQDVLPCLLRRCFRPG